jgi:hypothetical protein
MTLLLHVPTCNGHLQVGSYRRKDYVTCRYKSKIHVLSKLHVNIIVTVTDYMYSYVSRCLLLLLLLFECRPTFMSKVSILLFRVCRSVDGNKLDTWIWMFVGIWTTEVSLYIGVHVICASNILARGWTRVFQLYGVWEYGAAENIWAQEGRGDRGVEKTT